MKGKSLLFSNSLLMAHFYCLHPSKTITIHPHLHQVVAEDQVNKLKINLKFPNLISQHLLITTLLLNKLSNKKLCKILLRENKNRRKKRKMRNRKNWKKMAIYVNNKKNKRNKWKSRKNLKNKER